MLRLLLLSVLLIRNDLVSSVETNDDRIVSRSQWGSSPVSSDGLAALDVRPASVVVIHHSETRSCTNQGDCGSRIRSIQIYHQLSKRWDDIGYNFLVGEDGNVYEGRGWGKTGAHVRGHNSNSIGICMIGSFQNSVPNDAAIEAVKNLIVHGVSINEIQSNYTLKGHRDLAATDCPGHKLFELIKTWPHWSDGKE